MDADAASLAVRVGSDVEALHEALERNDAGAAEARYPGAFLHGVYLAGLGTELEGWIVETREGLARRVRALLTDAAERAAARSAQPPATLPREVTSFVGREAELLELGRVLASGDRPLVTLVGPGGIGKTRLALALARDARASGAYEDGVHFVPLEEATAAREIPARIAATLGVTPRGHRPARDALRRACGDRRALWVLDNLDQLADVPGPVADLVHACPGVTLLATSRRRLQLEEESAYPLQGLGPPDGGGYDEANESIRLFLDRARRSRLDYRPDEAERRAIAEIVARVEGAPLAIELAAVWLQHGTAVQAAGALRASFDALASRSRNVEARHRSLRASFDASWQDLDRELREALRRLAVFRGGFDEQAAAEVADVPAEALLELAGRSLLAPQGDGRFGFHPLIRAYASERLEVEPSFLEAMRRRHARHVLARARRWDAAFYDRDQAEAQARFERERANLAAAERWALRHEPSLALALVDARGRWWRFAGRFAEGRVAALRALRAGASADAGLRARGLHVAGAMAYRLSDFPAARRDLTAALAAARRAADDEAELRVVQTLGNVAVAQQRADEAEARFREALPKASACGDVAAQRSALTGLGEAAALRGDLDEAEGRFREVLAVAERDGTPTSVSTSLFNLGMVARERGDAELARRRFEEALAGDTDVGDRWGAALTLHQLGSVAYEQGR